MHRGLESWLAPPGQPATVAVLAANRRQAPGAKDRRSMPLRRRTIVLICRRPGGGWKWNLCLPGKDRRACPAPPGTAQAHPMKPLRGKARFPAAKAVNGRYPLR
jgi:hypothetical protein